MLFLFGVLVLLWPIFDLLRGGGLDDYDVMRWFAKQPLGKIMFYNYCVLSGMLIMAVACVLP